MTTEKKQQQLYGICPGDEPKRTKQKVKPVRNLCRYRMVLIFAPLLPARSNFVCAEKTEKDEKPTFAMAIRFSLDVVFLPRRKKNTRPEENPGKVFPPPPNRLRLPEMLS